jgi:ankyrin repeat protein
MRVIVRITFAVITAWIASLVLAYEGFVPVHYIGGLMSASVITLGCFLARQTIGMSENDAFTFARISIVITLLLASWTATETLYQNAVFRMQSELNTTTPTIEQQTKWWQETLSNSSASGGLTDAIKLRAHEGIIYGFRENYLPSKLNHNIRRGFWVWVCWVGQIVLLTLGALIGCLAISTIGKKDVRHQKSALDSFADSVESSLKAKGDDLSARAASAMIRGSDDLPEISKQIHHRRLEQEANGDPTAFMFSALSTYYSEWVTEALGNGADPNAIDPRGNPAILLAARSGSIEALEALLAHGACIEQTNNLGDTPLHAAAKEGQIKMISRLLRDNGVRADTKNARLQTALFIACDRGHLDAAQLLFAQGANLTTMDSFGNHAIHVAAKNGHVDVIRWLLGLGINPDIQTESSVGVTPLQLAVSFRHEAVVGELLRAGSSPEGKTDGGMTPLMSAADAGSLNIVKRLLKAGAKKQTTCQGLTAFNYAEQAERPSPTQKKVIKLLHL